MPNHVPLFLRTPQPNLSTFCIRRGSVRTTTATFRFVFAARFNE
jgi:hypothetical protein